MKNPRQKVEGMTCNHFHLLLEVPPMPEGGIADEELLKRLRGTSTEAYVADVAKGVVRPQLNTAEALEAKDKGTLLADLGMAAMLRCRVRYFTDGAVIGSRDFVNEAFAGARERFAARRKDGARRMRGSGSPAAGVLWSLRDLRLRM
jgi:hypothetical protein